MPTSLRTTLVVYTLLIVLVVGVGISLCSIWYGRHHITDSFEAKYKSTAIDVAGSLVDSLYFLDVRAMHVRLRNAARSNRR